MKKLLTLLFCFIAFLCNANEFYYYFSMDATGVLEEYEINVNAFTVTINSIEISENGYIRCSISIDCPHSEENYIICRGHANDQFHKLSDETDPYWNMKLQPEVNPRWCSYEYTGNKITFVDMFHKSLLLNENPKANALRYYVRDELTGHTLIIQITNILYYNIVTSINQISYSEPVLYFDLNGNSSSTPFQGINIIKKGNITYKVIY